MAEAQAYKKLGSTGSARSTAASASATGDLMQGSRGDSVKELQTALNGAGYDLAVDGIFGSKTAGALKSWQESQGIDPTGVFNTASRDILYAPTPAAEGAEAEAAPADRYASIRDELIAGLQNSIGNGYTPKTEEQIQAEAAARVQSQYDAHRLAAQQSADNQRQALDSQLEALGLDYDRAVQDSNRQYNRAASQLDRAMLSRGMQRSSYAMSSLANIGNEGARAAGDIRAREAAARSGIEGQRALLDRQLAQQMAQYDVSQANDAMAYADQLRNQEYERGVQERNTGASLTQNLLQILMNAQQQGISQDQWERQFAESIREWNLANGYNADGSAKKKSSSGGRTGGTGGTGTGTDTGAAAGTTDVSSQYSSFLSALGNALNTNKYVPTGKGATTR